MHCLLCGNDFIALKDCSERGPVYHYWCQRCKAEFEVTSLEVVASFEHILNPEFVAKEFERAKDAS
jgi:hypothetical protein